MKKIKKTTLHIQGMHCASCNVLIEDKFKEVKNIQDVKANFSKQEAEVLYTGQLDTAILDKHIEQFGYRIAEKSQIVKVPFWQRFTNVTVLAGIMFILYFFAQELHIIPDFKATAGSTLTYISVFILGIVASTSTCMATSGALFMATIGKQQKHGAPLLTNLLPAISFNIGRIASYGFFGFVVGAIGNVLFQSIIFSTITTLFITVGMILIGLSMTGLISFSPLTDNNFTKNIFQTLEARLIKHPKKTAFFLGAITYLLPCGFTQSVQLYALGLANPLHSALVMMIFAFGTMPLLIGLAFTNSFKNYSFYPYFQKVIGIIILAIGINYAANALALHGIKFNITSSSSSTENVKLRDGFQIAEMSVNAQGYSPNVFVVKENIPVKWIVKGENIFGCQGFLVAPQMNIQSSLKIGENIFKFTPKSKGTLSFSCSMGMYRGQFNVI